MYFLPPAKGATRRTQRAFEQGDLVPSRSDQAP